MATTLLTEMAAELASAHAHIMPRIAGLENFLRLGVASDTLNEEARNAVDVLRVSRTERRILLDKAIDALDALGAHGYPELPAMPVAELVIENLRQELTEVTLALGEFAHDESAQSLNLTAAEPEPK